jgi:hypothetical protein
MDKMNSQDKCPKGHEYDRVNAAGKRYCSICYNAYQKAYGRKKRKERALKQGREAGKIGRPVRSMDTLYDKPIDAMEISLACQKALARMGAVCE